MNLLKRWFGSKESDAAEVQQLPSVLRLELLLPPDYARQLIALEPDAEGIRSTVQGQPWDDITFVVLRRDEEAGVELSGSLSPADGLSVRYWEDGKEFVSERAPSLEEGIRLLQLYARRDERWRSVVRWH